MPFEIPTLPALVQRAGEDLARAGVDGVLRRSDVAVLSRVMGGGAFGLYGLLQWLARQILPDSCDEDQLARWAQIKDVPRTPATVASGTIDVSGADGVVIVTGFVWQSRSGHQFVSVQDATIAGGVASVSVAAVELGQVGNLPAGSEVSAVSPLVGLAAQGVVGAGGIVGGTDEEPVERWRRRVVRAFRVQPHGGDLEDYVTWALEVPGVTRAWSRGAWVGPGTVGVFVVRDDDEDIVPDEAELDAVRDHIATRQPVTAEVHVVAPTLLPVHYQIRLDPDSETLRARVELALRELHMAEADLGGRLWRSHMTATISGVPGELDHTLVAPAADIVPQAHELPTFGSVSWL